MERPRIAANWPEAWRRRQVHLPEAVLRGDVALGEDEVVERARVDVGDAACIALNCNRRGQAIDGE